MCVCVMDWLKSLVLEWFEVLHRLCLQRLNGSEGHGSVVYRQKLENQPNTFTHISYEDTFIRDMTCLHSQQHK